MSNDTKTILAVVVVTILLLVGFVAIGGNNKGLVFSPITTSNPELVRDYSPRLGPDTAAVRIVEFADLQCPACARTAPFLKQANAEYGDRIQIVYRHFPLPSHSFAMPAARAAEAANAQGKFWEMAELMFADQSRWSTSLNPDSIFVEYATSLGLDLAKFQADRDNQDLIDHIRRDAGDGEALQVNATPTLYLNGQPLETVISYEDLKATIDAALVAPSQ